MTFLNIIWNENINISTDQATKHTQSHTHTHIYTLHYNFVIVLLFIRFKRFFLDMFVCTQYANQYSCVLVIFLSFVLFSVCMIVLNVILDIELFWIVHVTEFDDSWEEWRKKQFLHWITSHLSNTSSEKNNGKSFFISIFGRSVGVCVWYTYISAALAKSLSQMNVFRFNIYTH